MQPSRGIQLALICAAGALLFFTSFILDRGGKLSGSQLASVAVACLVVLGVILLIARRAQPGRAVPSGPRGSTSRTVAFLGGLALIETVQISSISAHLRFAGYAIASGLLIWAIVSSRRARRE